MTNYSKENKENFLNSFEVIGWQEKTKRTREDFPSLRDPMVIEPLKEHLPTRKASFSKERRVSAVRSVSLKRTRGEFGDKIENIRVCFGERNQQLGKVTGVITNTDYSFSSVTGSQISSRRSCRALSCNFRKETPTGFQSLRENGSGIKKFGQNEGRARDGMKPEGREALLEIGAGLLDTPQSTERKESSRRASSRRSRRTLGEITRELASNDKKEEFSIQRMQPMKSRDTQRSQKIVERSSFRTVEMDITTSEISFEEATSISNQGPAPFTIDSRLFEKKKQPEVFIGEDVEKRDSFPERNSTQKSRNTKEFLLKEEKSDRFMERVEHKYSSLSMQIDNVLQKYKSKQNEDQNPLGKYKSLQTASVASSQRSREPVSLAQGPNAQKYSEREAKVSREWATKEKTQERRKETMDDDQREEISEAQRASEEQFKLQLRLRQPETELSHQPKETHVGTQMSQCHLNQKEEDELSDGELDTERILARVDKTLEACASSLQDKPQKEKKPR